MHSTQHFAARRRQAGSVVVYTAIILLAILTATVLAIELGRIYQARQQYQKMASLAALDVASLVGGCDSTVPPTQAQLEARVQASLQRNGNTADITLTVVEAGTVATDASTGLRYLVPSDLATAQAVRVTLTGRFPAVLTGLLPQNDSMRLSATAARAAVGAFTIGSGLIDVDANNLVLGGMLGDSVNLTAVDYQGLLNAGVSLGQLALAVGLEVQDLSDPLRLSAEDPTLSEVLTGLSEQLDQAGEMAAAAALDVLAQAAAAGANPAVPLDLLVGATDGTAADVQVSSAFDLVNSLLQAAVADDGGSVTPIPISNQVVTSVGTVSTFLRVLEPARPGIGRPGSAEAVARTAQVQLLVRIDGGPDLSGLQTTLATTVSTLADTLLSGLGVVNVPTTVTVAPAPLKLGVDVAAASAAAYLDRIDCPRGTVNDGDPVAALSAQTGLATVAFGTYSGAGTDAPALSPAGSIPLAEVAIDATCAVRAPITNACLSNLGSQTLDIALQASTAGVGSTGPAPLPLDVTAFTFTESLSDGKAGYTADGVPPQAPVPGNPQTVGSSASLGLALALDVDQTGTLLSPLDTVAAAVESAAGSAPEVATLMDTINGLVADQIDPLLAALGVRTGVADVTMQSVSTDQPRLVSTCLPGSTFQPPRGCPAPN